MKISIFTTVTAPYVRGDLFDESLNCYNALADEVIIVDGKPTADSDYMWQLKERKKTKVIFHKWPKEFDWPLIGEQFQRGYEAATGDWVIHADLDFIFHEKDFAAIRKAFEENSKQPALSFWKYQFILPDRYNLKSRLVIAVNKKVYGDRIRFDSGGDLCQPSLDGEEIKPDYVNEARVPFYNYEKMTKTADQIMEDCGRMDRAYHRHFKSWQLCDDNSGSDESCFNGYIKLLRGRFNKPCEHIKLRDHPIFVQETIAGLRKNQFGFNGFGLFGDNDYLREIVNA